MKKVELTGDTINGAHVICNQELEVGEKVLYNGQVVTVTEVLHVGKPYKALGQGDTYEEMRRNAHMVQLCWARVDAQLLKNELVFVTGTGLPADLPGEDD